MWWLNYKFAILFEPPVGFFVNQDTPQVMQIFLPFTIATGYHQFSDLANYFKRPHLFPRSDMHIIQYRYNRDSLTGGCSLAQPIRDCVVERNGWEEEQRTIGWWLWWWLVTSLIITLLSPHPELMTRTVTCRSANESCEIGYVCNIELLQLLISINLGSWD